MEGCTWELSTVVVEHRELHLHGGSGCLHLGEPERVRFGEASLRDRGQGDVLVRRESRDVAWGPAGGALLTGLGPVGRRVRRCGVRGVGLAYRDSAKQVRQNECPHPRDIG